MASLAKRALRSLRPRFQHEVEAVVAPTYARADDLSQAVEDIRRILSEQADSASEEAAVFGRLLAGLRAEVEELHAAVDRLAARLEPEPDQSKV
jgi:tRNA C32,U32 (ribose-2'-O)-methylase TrmJ